MGVRRHAATRASLAANSVSAGAIYKRPESVLVVIHTPDLEILLLERVTPPGFWQSVTGSLEDDESPLETAVREVAEETGLAIVSDDLCDWHRTNQFEIRAEWRDRYAPDVSINTEYVFSLCLPAAVPVRLCAAEHTAQIWLPRSEAAEKVFSRTNRDAILRL